MHAVNIFRDVSAILEAKVGACKVIPNKPVLNRYATSCTIGNKESHCTAVEGTATKQMIIGTPNLGGCLIAVRKAAQTALFKNAKQIS